MSALFGTKAALSSTANCTVCGTHQLLALNVSPNPTGVAMPPSTVVVTAAVPNALLLTALIWSMFWAFNAPPSKVIA